MHGKAKAWTRLRVRYVSFVTTLLLNFIRVEPPKILLYTKALRSLRDVFLSAILSPKLYNSPPLSSI